MYIIVGIHLLLFVVPVVIYVGKPAMESGLWLWFYGRDDLHVGLVSNLVSCSGALNEL